MPHIGPRSYFASRVPSIVLDKRRTREREPPSTVVMSGSASRMVPYLPRLAGKGDHVMFRRLPALGALALVALLAHSTPATAKGKLHCRNLSFTGQAGQ